MRNNIINDRDFFAFYDNSRGVILQPTAVTRVVRRSPAHVPRCASSRAGGHIRNILTYFKIFPDSSKLKREFTRIGIARENYPVSLSL